MKRWLGWIGIGWMLVLVTLALARYGNPSPHVPLAARVRAVGLQLRCPVCQGESVADSSASEAGAMRTLIRQQLAHGESPSAVKAYFVSKYGDWILLAPPVSGMGSFAWVAPPLLFLGGLGLLVTLVLGWQTRGRPAAGEAKQSYVDRVRAELAAEAIED